MKIKNLFLLLILFSFTFIIPKSFNLRNRTSVFKISSGSNLILDKTMNAITGKIIKDSGAEISGEDMEFKDGSFQDSESKIKIIGKLNFGDIKKIILDGGKTFLGKRGEVTQSLSISGINNVIEGVLFTSNDINLLDENSYVSFDIRNRLDSNINLNDGHLKLNEDLFFLDDKRIFGPGRVILNGHKLSFGATDLVWKEPILFEKASDIEINSNTYLEDTWTFSGDSVLCGNANILCTLCSDGIVLRPNTNLLIRDAVLYGISSNKIRCLTDDSTLTLQNVKWIQDADFTFSRGSLILLDNVEFIGKGKKFIYQSQMTCTVKQNAFIRFSTGFTFSYDPIVDNKNLLKFEDDTSTIYLDGSSLYCSYKGLNLSKGRIISDKNSHFLIEEREWVHSTITGTEEFDGITYTTYDYTYGTSGGMFVGSDDSNYDFNINILSGSTLNINNGTLYYRNINLDSIDLVNDFSSIKINDGAHLKLDQTLDVSPGKIIISGFSALQKQSGKYLLGSTFYS